MREIRFDDIERLRAEKSEQFGGWSAEVEVTQAMIQAFADLTGDHQWIHVDVERARRESPFGGTIAHGFLTLALVGRMRPPAAFAIIGYGSAMNYGAEGLRFLAPVPSGSRLHARMRLCDVEARPKGTLTSSEVAIHVVGNDKPSLLYRALVLYQPARKDARA
jgi:acyl dehydratase